ncbi:hypothetical protein Tco_1021846 [Tanacetum coccineum]
MPRDFLRIIESKSKVRNSRNKPVVAKVSSSSSTPGISPDVAELKDMVTALLLDKKNQNQAPTPVKVVEESCVTCRGSGTLPSNTITNPKVDLKGITTRSDAAYQGPTIPTTTSSPPKVVEHETEVTKDTVPPTNNGSTKDVQPPVVQVQSQVPNSKPVVDPVFFLKTGRALIDVYKGELTLRVGNKAITFNLDQTSRYSANYNDMTANRIDVIDMACEEYSQEVLGFSDVSATKNDKSSIDEPPEVELKDLPPHLEYTFLEGDDKLPVIIAKDLSVKEKAALIKVLKSHKRAISWKLSDIKGINPEFCTHKILMEEDYKPAVQHQRWVNPKIHDVIKKEVEKLLDARLIYPISDTPWVSPIHCVVENDENELIPTSLVMGWRETDIQEKNVLQSPTEGYEDAIVVPEIEASNIRDQGMVANSCPEQAVLRT